jgi:hypothetical protein
MDRAFLKRLEHEYSIRFLRQSQWEMARGWDYQSVIELWWRSMEVPLSAYQNRVKEQSSGLKYQLLSEVL